MYVEIRVQKNMLVELCAGNYATHDGLVNGADGLFKGSSLLPNSQTIIWILFNNSKTKHLTRIKSNHIYTQEIHPISRGVHSLLYSAYTCVWDLFIGGYFTLQKNYKVWYFSK